MKALDLAGIGMDCLAAVAAGLYTSAKFADQIRKTDDEKRAMQPGTAVGPAAWSTGATDDDEVEPDAEELLWAWEESRFKDRYTDMLMAWGNGFWDKLGFFGRARIPFFIPAAPVLFFLAAPWILLRLPFLIVTFVRDQDNDFRLRIIVLSFGLGLCLQFASAAVG